MRNEELTAKMKEIDEQLSRSRKQLKAESHELRQVHNFFDSVAEDALIQLEGIRQEKKSTKSEKLWQKAELITDNSEEEEW